MKKPIRPTNRARASRSRRSGRRLEAAETPRSDAVCVTDLRNSFGARPLSASDSPTRERQDPQLPGDIWRCPQQDANERSRLEPAQRRSARHVKQQADEGPERESGK